MVELSPILFTLLLGILRGALYCLIGVGLTLVFGVMGVVNFAHGEFYMLGAYVAFFTLTLLGVPPLVAILLAIVSTFLMGCVVERVTLTPLRKRGKKDWLTNTFVLTLGLQIFFRNFAQLVWGTDYRGVGHLWEGSVKFLRYSVAIENIITFIIAVIIIIAFWIFMQKTRIGKAIRATEQNAEGALLSGINVDRIYTLSFGLGAMFAGAAGALLLPIFAVYPAVGATPTIKAFTIAILGGLGSFEGAAIGGFLLGICEAFAYYYGGDIGLQNIIPLVIVILVILIKPSGLFGREVE